MVVMKIQIFWKVMLCLQVNMWVTPNVRGTYCMGPKMWHVRNGVYTVESMWQVAVNITIRWGCMNKSHW